jgi:hypothetical protein
MPRMNILNAGEREAFDSPPVFNSFQRKQILTSPPNYADSPPASAVRPGGSLQAAHQELHHLLELSLPFAEVRRDQGYRQPGGFSRRGGPWLGDCLAASQPARRVWLLGREAARQHRNSTPKIGGLNGGHFGGSQKSENPIYQRR